MTVSDQSAHKSTFYRASKKIVNIQYIIFISTSTFARHPCKFPSTALTVPFDIYKIFCQSSGFSNLQDSMAVRKNCFAYRKTKMYTPSKAVRHSKMRPNISLGQTWYASPRAHWQIWKVNIITMNLKNMIREVLNFEEASSMVLE